MAVSLADLELANAIFHNAGWVIFYLFVGGGPGFIFGLLLANFVWGRGEPTLFEVHLQNLAEAGEHNKKLSPNHPRWKK